MTSVSQLRLLACQMKGILYVMNHFHVHMPYGTKLGDKSNKHNKIDRSWCDCLCIHIASKLFGDKLFTRTLSAVVKDSCLGI